MTVDRLTQAERRARTRSRLLEAAARRLSAGGYAELSLEEVARSAGYTRGALYHQFAGKEDLAIAVVAWVEETWNDEVGSLVGEHDEPLGALLALARGHAVYCRRDIARVMVSLRVDCCRPGHPVGAAVDAALDRLIADCARLVSAARRSGAIPAGPPAALVARAYLAAVEGAVIAMEGKAPHDVVVAERVALGVLGLVTPPA